MRILLINPPYHRLKGMKDIFFPLGIGYLGSYLKQHGSDREIKLYNVENPSPQEIDGFLNVKSLIQRNEMFESNYKSDDHIIWNEVREVIRTFKPDIVGLTIMSCKYRPALKITKIIKEISPQTITVWGGPHCSASGIECVEKNESIDYAVTNEGEIAFEELVSIIEKERNQQGLLPEVGLLKEVPNLVYREGGKVIQNHRGAAIDDLNELPFPLKDADVFQSRYPAGTLCTITASRGCPFECTFCDSKNVWGRSVRYRSTENILAEMKEMHEKFGVDVVNFCDDTFTLNKSKTMDFCKELEKSDLSMGWTCTTRLDVLSDELCVAMKNSGLVSLTCGVESGSDRILKEIKKSITVEGVLRGIGLLEKHGIDWSGFFMVGFPTERVEDIEKTKELWKKIKPSTIYLSIFTPYPGSELCNVTKELGLLPEDPDWSSFSHQNLNNHFIKSIPKEQFQVIVEQMFEYVENYNNSFFTLTKKALRRRKYYMRNVPYFFSLVTQKLGHKYKKMREAA